MIKVYLRHEAENESSFLGKFKVEQIGDLVELAKSRECYFDKYSVNGKFVFAGFVVDEKQQAYFEILFS